MTNGNNDSRRRVLVFRLSSLGDVVLATSVLSGSMNFEIDWVVASEFAELLQGHPRINKVWSYDRRSGLKSWLDLCRQLRAAGYDEVWDLHDTLRTRVAQFIFSRGAAETRPRWSRLRKERWRMRGMFLFKAAWPRVFRPRSFVERYSRFGNGDGKGRPNLKHLLRNLAEREGLASEAYQWINLPEGVPYYCVMPGSKWEGKCWPARKYLEVIRNVQGIPVVLGGGADQEARRLLELLRAEEIEHRSGVGQWDLSQVAKVLTASKGYLGNDTGLAHLSEALGRPALVIFGPTSPEMGFGPWKEESASLGADLWCRPCGKDGRHCQRPFRKYLCMEKLETGDVSRRVNDMMSGGSE
jgi:ADP-heptose:LPS heptosyltransferase